MITIREVAKEAGVSISTVSRALSNSGLVEDSTTRRIVEAVNKLGYKPNMMARGLKNGNTRTFALILPSIENPYYAKLATYLEKIANENGYLTFLCISNYDKEQEVKNFETAKNYGVDGVILLPATDDESHMLSLKQMGLPMVLINRLFDIGVPGITNDNHTGSKSVITYLIKNGHRRIGVLARTLRLQHYRQRYEGCIDALNEYKIEDYEKYLAFDVESSEEAYQATMRLLNMECPPTAFFSFTDINTLGIYSAIIEKGLKIPEDISVASFDNNTESKYMLPPLTTYNHPADQIAEKAIGILSDMVENGETEKYQEYSEVISGALVVRKSVASV